MTWDGSQTPVLPGQINGSGSDRAMFLKQFGNEVAALFDQKAKFRNLFMTKRVTGGETVQFPVMGLADNVGLHKKGAVILGDQVVVAERTVKADEYLYNALFLPRIQELMNHYDVQGQYKTRIVDGLVKFDDQRLARLIVNAARVPTPFSKSSLKNYHKDQRPGKTGGALTVGGAEANLEAGGWSAYADGAEFAAAHVDTNLRIDETDPDALEAALYYIAADMDERNIPTEGRFVSLRPKEYMRLIRKPGSGFGSPAEISHLLNRDFSTSGSLADLELPTIAGLKILKSNHVPGPQSGTDGVVAESAEETAAGGFHGNNAYFGNFKPTVAVAWHQTALGTAILDDITVGTEWQLSRLGHLMVAYASMGTDILRPETAYEITSSNVRVPNPS